MIYTTINSAIPTYVRAITYDKIEVFNEREKITLVSNHLFSWNGIWRFPQDVLQSAAYRVMMEVSCGSAKRGRELIRGSKDAARANIVMIIVSPFPLTVEVQGPNCLTFPICFVLSFNEFQSSFIKVFFAICFAVIKILILC